MAFRAAFGSRPVLRGLARARQQRPSASIKRSSRTQHVTRRGYASESGHGHGGHAPPGSDLPWALGGIAVTVPSCYYLWPSSQGDHGHHGHSDKHEEHADEEKTDPEPVQDDGADASESEDEKPSKDDQSNDDSADDGKEDKKDSAKTDDDDDDDKSTESETTKGGKVEGVQFKGKTSAGDDDNEMQHTVKIEDDSKGAKKKRIDSGYQKDLGSKPEGDGDDDSESAASSKEVSSSTGDISKKQKGLSGTPTRHSTDIGNDPEKSKKGEGIPETAKSMGTVSVNRDAK